MSNPSLSNAVAPDKAAIVYRPDNSLTHQEEHQLRRLLFASFPYEPAFLTRRYLKQCPAHRWLALEGTKIIGHAAVHDKRIGTAGGELRVGGVCEVCVDASRRGHGLSKLLLTAVHEWLTTAGFPFAMLFGQPKVYTSGGYQLIANEIRADNALARHWNPFCGKAMIKPIANLPWPAGPIDLHGPTF